MKGKIETYNSKSFRKEYFNDDLKLNELFEYSIVDFFCLSIEELINGVLKPILPSREESHTLIYVTEGSYKTKIGFKEYEIKPNQLLVIQAGVVFSVDEIIKNVKGFTCHFHPDTLIGKFGSRSLISELEFLNVGNYPVVEIPNSVKETLITLFTRLAEEFKKEFKLRPDIVHCYLYTILTELKILFGDEITINKNSAYGISLRFRQLVHQNVKENPTVAKLAEILNLSPNHLNKSVKVVTSKSALEVINEIKLIEIKYLLHQSELSISEIAFNMGYSDPSYFTRFFSKKEKVSPRKYREMIEKS